jgi:hypothetical protein
MIRPTMMESINLADFDWLPLVDRGDVENLLVTAVRQAPTTVDPNLTRIGWQRSTRTEAPRDRRRRAVVRGRLPVTGER